jgi:hypothetical protein
LIETLLTKPARLKYVFSRGEDQYGQPVFQTEYRDTKCYYRLMNTALGDAVSVSEMEIRVHLPATTTVDGLQGLSIDGTEYQPSGLVHRQWNPRRQRVEYLTLKVKRAT